MWCSERKTLVTGLQVHKRCTSGVCEWHQHRGPHVGDAWGPFLFRSADPGRGFFFLEGIPPAWLLQYRLAGCIYIHTVTRKPAPTAEKEADLFSTKLKQNWNKLMQPVTVGVYIWAGARLVFQSPYKLLLGLQLTIIYWLFSWLINCLVHGVSANSKKKMAVTFPEPIETS